MRTCVRRAGSQRVPLQAGRSVRRYAVNTPPPAGTRAERKVGALHTQQLIVTSICLADLDATYSLTSRAGFCWPLNKRKTHIMQPLGKNRKNSVLAASIQLLRMAGWSAYTMIEGPLPKHYGIGCRNNCNVATIG